jgi:hypothetical protein
MARVSGTDGHSVLVLLVISPVGCTERSLLTYHASFAVYYAATRFVGWNKTTYPLPNPRWLLFRRMSSNAANCL